MISLLNVFIPDMILRLSLSKFDDRLRFNHDSLHHLSNDLNITFTGKRNVPAINQELDTGRWCFGLPHRIESNAPGKLAMISSIKYNAHAAYHLCELIALYGAASAVRTI